ncbi:MAG: DUF2911 domain-containing protein [Bacteroidia bacterium]|nr:DUF2911 domain-containing protein [Bacteroidia bacterium]
MKTHGRLLFAMLLLASGLSCNNSKEEKKDISDSKKMETIDSIEKTNKEIAIDPYSPVDISPMDMSYYPPDYPKLKMTKTVTTPPVARVIYSRPHLQGRQLFHALLKYGEPWRLGANESTELDLFSDVTIQDKKIKAGRYILYCIPQPTTWTIILNSNLDSWGLHPDSTKDIARFDVPVKETDRHLEYLNIIFEKIDNGAALIMAWDNVEARLPINF